MIMSAFSKVEMSSIMSRSKGVRHEKRGGHFGEEPGIEATESDRAGDRKEAEAAASGNIAKIVGKANPAADRLREEGRDKRFNPQVAREDIPSTV